MSVFLQRAGFLDLNARYVCFYFPANRYLTTRVVDRNVGISCVEWQRTKQANKDVMRFATYEYTNRLGINNSYVAEVNEQHSRIRYVNI